MRLTDFEKQVIHNSCINIFGQDSRIYLFGSRVDDSRRGGDIDLYIDPGQQSELDKKESEFLSLLFDQIGEQSIDIVFKHDEHRLIEQEAMRKGVQI